jgi:hypothetical protein
MGGFGIWCVAVGRGKESLSFESRVWVEMEVGCDGMR